MNKLINAIPEERILDELNYILNETVNAFVYNEKYRIPILNEFKREIDLMARLIGERIHILTVLNLNIVSVLNAFENDSDNFDCSVFVGEETFEINVKRDVEINLSMIMTKEEFEKIKLF